MKKLKAKGKYWVMNGKALRNIGKNGLTIQYVFLICVGILLSAVILKASGDQSLVSQFSQLCIRYFKLKEGQGILTNSLDSVLINGCFLFGCLLSGFSVLGGMWVDVLCLLRGSIIGMAIGTLYRTNSKTGLAFSAVILIPAAVLCTIFFIISCKQSRVFSRKIAENGIKETGKHSKEDIPSFVFREFVLILFTAVACVFGAVLQRLFGSFFVIS